MGVNYLYASLTILANTKFPFKSDTQVFKTSSQTQRTSFEGMLMLSMLCMEELDAPKQPEL